MGSATSKLQSPPPTSSSSSAWLQDQPLNTKDLESALDLVLNLGKPRAENEELRVFGLIERARTAVMDFVNSNKDFSSFAESDTGKEVSRRLTKLLDADGDGRVTARDFQLMYDKDLKRLIRRNEGTLNAALPFVGQCAFGFGAGYAAGNMAFRAYKNKYLILTSGTVLYSGVQYLAQMNLVNQKQLESVFREKVHQLMDVNSDGELNRDDLNFLIENRMKYVATKLGPGGIAPGLTGYATLAIGMLRGLRYI